MTQDLTREERERLAELEKLRTQGEWALSENGDIRAFPTAETVGDMDFNDPDEAYVLAACNAVPKLLAKLDRAEEKVKKLADAAIDHGHEDDCGALLGGVCVCIYRYARNALRDTDSEAGK
jgi:hypothetical protein